MLKDFTPRLYQQTLFSQTTNKNSLIVLPTGLGKTALALMLAAHRKKLHPQKNILLVAPTKPLCEQHVTTFQKHLPHLTTTLFTGSISPKKRTQLFNQTDIIIATPQTIEADLINSRYNLEDICLLVIDEAHRATGDYAYVWIAKQYNKTALQERILALTASPGSNKEKIKEICTNLHIEHLDVRTPHDPDVKPYVKEVETTWHELAFPQELKEIHKKIETAYKARLFALKQLGFANQSSLSKTQLLAIQRDLQKKVMSKDPGVFEGLSLVAQAMKIDHALGLLESQGITPLVTYLQDMFDKAKTTKTKAIKKIVTDPHINTARNLATQLAQANTLHPKYHQLHLLIADQLEQDKQAKVIVFTQFRDTATHIVNHLQNNNLSTHLFLGQAKRKGVGFSQKEQKEILDKFRNNEFSVLVSSSVGEEGLDIPKVDHVIFFEPIPSAIRHIQRAGRTGRLNKGAVSVLMTKGTRDEIYRWSAHHKEKRMYRELAALKGAFTFEQKSQQPTLHDFQKKQEALIVADHREKDNALVKELIDQNIAVRTAQLTSADYILADRVGVELKKVPDFVSSLLDGRLFMQLKDLKRNFQNALLIIEGEENILHVRKVHPHAIYGALATISLDFQIPLLYTKNTKETAALFATIAKREQAKQATDYLQTRTAFSSKEQIEYVIASFPGVGKKTAQLLLNEKKTIHQLINTDKQELENMKGIGKQKAKQFYDLCHKEYKK